MFASLKGEEPEKEKKKPLKRNQLQTATEHMTSRGFCRPRSASSVSAPTRSSETGSLSLGCVPLLSQQKDRSGIITPAFLPVIRLVIFARRVTPLSQNLSKFTVAIMLRTFIRFTRSRWLSRLLFKPEKPCSSPVVHGRLLTPSFGQKVFWYGASNVKHGLSPRVFRSLCVRGFTHKVS